MATEQQVEWIGLDDATLAADRGRAPIGPELAGYIVLEATLRVREVGIGIVDATTVAIGTGGHVALSAQPARSDEAKAGKALRALLASVLEVATSSTPALRQCARRRDRTTLAALIRELEGALIPINRAASRRGVARVAKATLDALESGALERDDRDAREPSPSPVAVAAAPVRVEVAPAPVEVTPVRKSVPPPLPPPPIAKVDDGATPFTPGRIEPMGTPPMPLATLVAELEARHAEDDDQSEIEVVSNLPPIVEERMPMRIEEEQVVEAAIAEVRAATPEAPPSARIRTSDRVDALIDQFQVSRLRDDPALSKELKAMVGIETSMPPQVAPRIAPVAIRVAPRRAVELAPEIERDVAIDVDEPSPLSGSAAPVSADTTTVPPPAVARRRRSLYGSMMLLGACIALVAAAIARPSAVASMFAPAAPPPGDVPAAPPPTARVTSTPMAPAKMPTVCEASMMLEGVPAGSEVVRRLGTTPLSIAIPMHVPIDLVTSLEGSITRRVHIDASATWQQDPTSPRLELPITLDADPSKSGRWPTKGSVVPLRSAAELSASRGMLHATSTPPGATLWAIVEPANIGAIPCGTSVELLVIAPTTGPRTVRVEWSAFTGAPPRATMKL